MNKQSLADVWKGRARRFGLDVEAPFSFEIDTGDSITVDVLLRNFGAKNGMLLVTEFSLISSHLSEISRLEFGYSCLSELSQDEDPDKLTVELLSDWGWSGDGEPPGWLPEKLQG